MMIRLIYAWIFFRRQAWRRLRPIRATWRDTRILLVQFRWPLIAFTFLLLGGGWLYFSLAQIASEPIPSYAESVYFILGLVFLQSIELFPQTWYLQLFYFIIPIMGIAILAQGVADFGVLLFNRRTRNKDWEMAVASTLHNHIIVIGLGHLGFRVIKKLHELGRDIVVIEKVPDPDLAQQIQQMTIPLIEDDATRERALLAAGINNANSIVLCVQNDSVNLEIALKARNLNPNIKVTIRIFDDEFATALTNQFGFQALSATSMAAPIFAASASGIEMTQPINVLGESLSLAPYKVDRYSPLANKSVMEVEQTHDVSIVRWQREDMIDLHPRGDTRILPGDFLVLLASPTWITRLLRGELIQ